MEDYKELLLKNNRTNQINKFIQYTVILVDLFLLFLLFKSGFGIVSIIFFLILIFISSYGNILFLKKRKLESYNEVGKYSIEEIKEIISEVYGNINKKEKPNVYIVSLNTVNAFVTESVLKIIPPLNGLYLSEDLFKHLKPEELKSVIYHELGHFYYYMSPFSKNILPLDIFSVLLPFFLFFALGLKSIISLFFLVFFFSAVVRFFTFSNIKDYEYLSDFFSAQKNGILNMVNTLIVVSKINEVDSKIIRYIVERITRDKRLSFKDFDFYYENLRKEIPYEFQNFNEISEIIDNFLYDEAVDNIPEIDKHNYEYGEIKNWDSFDLNHNFRIEENEYLYLIDDLINNELSDVDNERQVPDITHPTLRKRILFMEGNKEYLESRV
ncbi:MAG: M48 family metalloprotease [Sebaldella sp.]|nr:M48 family metalloprotease [Sebaldella sp.]